MCHESEGYRCTSHTKSINETPADWVRDCLQDVNSIRQLVAIYERRLRKQNCQRIPLNCKPPSEQQLQWKQKPFPCSDFCQTLQRQSCERGQQTNRAERNADPFD